MSDNNSDKKEEAPDTNPHPSPLLPPQSHSSGGGGEKSEVGESTGTQQGIASTSTSVGILRVEPPPYTKAHQPGEPSSPAPSVDRLSVSFAPDDRSSWTDSSEQFPNPLSPRVIQTTRRRESSFSMATSPPPEGSEPTQARLSANLTDEDDDYSASMNAILSRRASCRKVKGLGRRRTSSPLDSDRRRSSVFTTSSGDTAITMEGEGGGGAPSQEQIFEQLKLHKEVLESVRQQPWEMRRRLKLVQQAKAYIKRHEGQLQERLAQSKSTKDIMARFNLLVSRYWGIIKRESGNLSKYLIPWEMRIKEIESHFGSVVSSYFLFLRWLFWINIIITLVFTLLIILPEYLAADRSKSGLRKVLLPSEVRTSAHLSTLWEFEGILKYSPLFYGYYSDQKTPDNFPLPLTYFLTALGVYIYSYVAILRKMAKNSRQSKLSEKDDECTFSWKIFTSWDFMIGNPETAFNKFASITMGFREALLEEKEKKKDERNWKVIALRVLANFLILCLLCLSAYAVVLVVQRSETVSEDSNWWRQNEITLVMSLITTIFPNIFELIGMLEKYHPRKALRWQLARIMALNFLNLYTLIFALFGKVTGMTEELQRLKANVSATTLSPRLVNFSPCMDYAVNCTLLSEYSSYEAKQNNQAILSIWTNLTTLIPDSSLVFNDSSVTWNANTTAKLNLTEWWELMHFLSPRTDVALGQILNLTSNIGPEFTESWSEIQENENITYWTNGTEVSLNETSFWPFPNATSFILALPMILKLIGMYRSTVIPPILASIKTTPMPTPTPTQALENFTSEFNISSFSTEFDFSFDTSTTPGPSSYGPTSEPTTESSLVLLNKIRMRKNGLIPLRTTPDEAGNFDYTEPDWSRFPLIDDEERGILFNGGMTEEEDGQVYKHEEYDETNGDFTLDLGRTRPRNYWDLQRQSTRGDMDALAALGEDTTTTMAPTTTEIVVEEAMAKFLTNLLTKLTIVFSHNSTKVDEIDVTKVRDYAKWITWLESEIETRRVSPQTEMNTTFGATFELNNENKDTQKCYINLCENGTTIPSNLPDYFNCSADLPCALKVLLGPKNDSRCIIPHHRDCLRITDPPPTIDPTISIKLRKLCWETMFGQELVKLTVMDLIFTIGFILVLDFIRAILVRILNPCWFWDLEKIFPQYGDFKIAENILHLVNNQGMIWMGMMFCPGLPAINLVKLVILMYIRSWAVMATNVPHETVFRASRSNNFYFALLLFMLFLCTLPVAYAVVWLEPSWHCGAFSKYQRIFHILTSTILDILPTPMHKVLDYIASPGIIVPLLLLLILIIYYLISLTGALRESNNDLKTQLRRERTEERRKMFKLAGSRKDSKPLDRWKMILPVSKMTTTTESSGGLKKKESILLTGKQTGFAGAIKRAALKAKKMKEAGGDDGSATDVEVSLSEDGTVIRKKSPIPTGSSKDSKSKGQASTPLLTDLQREAKGVRKPSVSDSITSRGEIPVIKISKEEDLKKPEERKPEVPKKPEKLERKPEEIKPEKAGDEKKGIDPSKKERVLKSLISKAKEEESKDRSQKEEEDLEILRVKSESSEPKSLSPTPEASSSTSSGKFDDPSPSSSKSEQIEVEETKLMSHYFNMNLPHSSSALPSHEITLPARFATIKPFKLKSTPPKVPPKPVKMIPYLPLSDRDEVDLEAESDVIDSTFSEMQSEINRERRVSGEGGGDQGGILDIEEEQPDVRPFFARIQIPKSARKHNS